HRVPAPEEEMLSTDISGADHAASRNVQYQGLSFGGARERNRELLRIRAEQRRRPAEYSAPFRVVQNDLAIGDFRRADLDLTLCPCGNQPRLRIGRDADDVGR